MPERNALRRRKKKHSNRLRRVIGQVEAVVFGLGAWCFLKPMDRDETAFDVALGLGIATFFFGGMLSDFIFGIRVHPEICFAGEDKHNQLSPGSGVAGHWEDEPFTLWRQDPTNVAPVALLLGERRLTFYLVLAFLADNQIPSARTTSTID